ncbi:hypothetical protein KL86DPRO_11410 [uncultured delta proteobacterium]|uniref:Uncharacterized protein n=1 Tax=uncultured delta proteobacterium TaxID=34034 RepID=A0A212JGK1_9DELT|nr:hypothetical protein KL86DPRO_11410 [uncultured delta proteobacterium]
MPLEEADRLSSAVPAKPTPGSRRHAPYNTL